MKALLCVILLGLMPPINPHHRYGGEANLPDIRGDLDLNDWDCPPGGDAEGEGDQDRNYMKSRNRAPVGNLEEKTWSEFLTFAQGHDQELTNLQSEADKELKTRITLSKKADQALNRFEQDAFKIT